MQQALPTDAAATHWVFRRPWTAAALLLLPMAAVYGAHLLFPPAGEWPTGFLQYDQQSYMAMARQAWEGGAWPRFALPSSADPDAPAQYLYLHIALLGALQGLTGWDPGRLYALFGLLAGLVFLRLAIALYARAVARRDGWAAAGLLLFAWGGGLFAAAGGTAALLEGRLGYGSLFAFDPYGGFWFLNLGRNLYYAVEAYYHALALGLLLALLDRRWRLAALLAAALLLSHPMTGLELVLIAAGYVWLERVLLRDRDLPLWLPLTLTALLGLHLALHLLLLPRSPEHAAVMAMWSRHFADFQWWQMLLAYGVVGLLAALRLRRAPGVWQDRRLRLLLVWFLVAFALVNHDLAIQPRQPLHFTRGYVWMPLFLLGAPLLVDWLARLSRPLALAVAALFLLDNAAWLTLQAAQDAGGFGAARTLSAEERGALAELAVPDYAGHLLVAEDLRLGYDALVYTPLQAWYSQEHSTPWSEARRADVERWQATGAEPADWRARPMVFLVADRGQDPSAYPWVTPQSRVRRLPGFLVIARPPPP